MVLTQFNGLFHGYYNKSRGLSAKNSNVLESMIHDIKPYLNLMYLIYHLIIYQQKSLFFILKTRALQLNGDMSEVLAAINKVSDPFIAGSCSALIKVRYSN